MMPTVFLDGKVTLHAGDCRDRIREIADNSIDSVVTDPPYALVSIGKRFGKEGAAAVKVPEGGSGAYARASKGFMGKQWDTGETAFAAEFWAEVLRVLKPGGHVVAFSGTRTYHRMACAIEDAGFEIRDQLAWTYGSGFPKSHDVSKGIDKSRKDDSDWRVVGSWLRSRREEKSLRQKDVAVLWPSVTGGLTGCVANWELGLSCPKWDQWLQLKEFIGFGDEMDAEVARLNGRKGDHGEAWQNAEVVDTREQGRLAVAPGQGEDRSAVKIKIKAANSDAARQWQGWGTALKPAWEPICLGRKPLIGTVAENVLTHGTGAINVDGCRPGDRFPANLVHDGSRAIVAAFPTEDGELSVARFFYTAKADGDDRLGSKHPTVKPVDLMQWLVRLVTPKGGTCLDPFAGTGTTGEAAFREGMRCVLIEREAEYQTDIKRRMELVMAGPDERRAAMTPQADASSLPLFGAGEATAA